MNGLINYSYPFFDAIDGLLNSAGAGALPRVVFWGAFSGLLAMLGYWLLSNQQKIQDKKTRIGEIRSKLAAHDGDDLGEVMRLSKQNLAAAMSLLGSALGPSVLASLPILVILFWVSESFGYDYKAVDTTLEVAVTGSGSATESWRVVQGDRDIVVTGGRFIIPAGVRPESIQVVDGDGRLLVALPSSPPGALFHQRKWWNVLVASESDYLPEPGPIEAVRVEYPRRDLFRTGPGWLRGWEFSYFLSLILVSLAIKTAFRIE